MIQENSINELIDFIKKLYTPKYISDREKNIEGIFVPLHEPKFPGDEKKYLLETIDSTFVSSVGAFGFISDILASESKYRAVEFLVKPAIFQDAMKGVDGLQRIYKDIEDYGIGAGKRLPKYIAPILGTVPRRAANQLETPGQKETYTRYRRGIIRGRILDALLEGKDKEANRMMQAWNRANPVEALYIEDIGVDAIFDRAYKKAVKRTKP